MQNINIELQQKNIGSMTHTKKIENNSKLEAHSIVCLLSTNQHSGQSGLCFLTGRYFILDQPYDIPPKDH